MESLTVSIESPPNFSTFDAGKEIQVIARIGPSDLECGKEGVTCEWDSGSLGSTGTVSNAPGQSTLSVRLPTPSEMRMVAVAVRVTRPGGTSADSALAQVFLNVRAGAACETCSSILGCLLCVDQKVVKSVFNPGADRFPVSPPVDTVSACPVPVPVSAPLPVVRAPCLSAAQINAILAANHSPARGLGQTFYDKGREYGIDPAIALAFFKQESSFGTAGVAVRTHSIGNIMYSASCPGIKFTAQNGREWCQYDSWGQGIDHWYALISGAGYVGGGLDTVEKIIPKYAPASENNVEEYVASVRSSVLEWTASTS